jgi:hypothetical protein
MRQDDPRKFPRLLGRNDTKASLSRHVYQRGIVSLPCRRSHDQEVVVTRPVLFGMTIGLDLISSKGQSVTSGRKRSWALIPEKQRNTRTCSSRNTSKARAMMMFCFEARPSWPSSLYLGAHLLLSSWTSPRAPFARRNMLDQFRFNHASCSLIPIFHTLCFRVNEAVQRGARRHPRA